MIIASQLLQKYTYHSNVMNENNFYVISGENCSYENKNLGKIQTFQMF